MKNVTESAFLQTEIRENFVVSEKRKRIWRVQLDLLEQVKHICEKNNLKYFASNGTLLGAVKYKGFIPWDDDLDIMMPRKDYEKFINLAYDSLKKPYYIQDGLSPLNDGLYFRTYARIRNSNTTALPWFDCNRRMENGIFIDIFPMDVCNENVCFVQRMLIKFLDRFLTSLVYYDSSRKKLYKMLKKKLSFFLFSFHLYEKMLSCLKHAFLYSSNCSNKKYFIYTHGKFLIVGTDLEKSIVLDFEFTKIPVLENFDIILKQQYGFDYMNSLPPETDRQAHHELFIDPCRPYRDYYGKLSENEFYKAIGSY